MKMNVDPGTPEAIFAQKLASCDSKVRKRALSRLRTWISARIKQQKYFDEVDMLKLWKGLYYCLWMQDKPLLQEELSENVSGLISSFDDVAQKFLFMETCFSTLSREWYAIDRWRMDKFMAFVRIFLRKWLFWLKEKKWKRRIVKGTLDVWKKSVLSPHDPTCPAGLKYHFASIYLDEIDNAGQSELSWDLLNTFLAPYYQLLGENGTSDALFNTVLKEIFETILLAASEEVIDSESESNQDAASGIKFDYECVASELFAVGKSGSVIGERRRKLYDFVRGFRLAAKGQDPQEAHLSDLGSDIDNEEIESAARRYIRRKTVDKNEKKAIRKELKKRSFASSDVSGEEDSDAEQKEQKPRKLKKRKKNSSRV